MKTKFYLLVISFFFLGTLKSNSQDLWINSISQPIYPEPINIMYPAEILIDFTYVPTTDPFYVSFYIQMPQGATQPIDLLEGNLFMPDFSNNRNLQIPIDLSRYSNFYQVGQPIDTFVLGAILSDTLIPNSILENPGFVDNYINFFPTMNVNPSFYRLGAEGILYDTNFLKIIEKVLSIPENQVKAGDTTRSVVRGCHMPNLDLDSSKHNSITDSGYAGDWNACVPTSCANSFEWLEARHPLELNSGLTHREKLKEFSKLMNRDTNTGVFTKAAIKGKLAFVDKYKMPVHVKFQSIYVSDSCVKSPDSTYDTRHCALNKMGPDGKINFDWIFSEMANGEDVELLVQFRKTTTCPGLPDKVVGWAHAVTLVDIIQSGNVRRFHLKDDSLQGRAGGTREIIVTYDTTASGKSHIKEWTKNYPLPGGKTVNVTSTITGVLSESLDTSVKFLTSLKDLKSKDESSFELIGNPSNGGDFQVRIICKVSEEMQLKVTDLSGKVVYYKDLGIIGKGVTNVEIKDMKVSSGAYFVTIYSAKGKNSMKMVVY